jgi:hypothetical protein
LRGSMHGDCAKSEKGVTEMEPAPNSQSFSAAMYASTNPIVGWLRLAVLATFFAILLACDETAVDQCPSNLTRANGPSCDVSVSFCQELLLRRAKCGDWKSAADVGWHRAFKEGKADPQTILLLRQWYAHDNRAWFALAHALARSCSAADRSEAIQVYEAYKRSPEFAVTSDAKQRDTEHQLQSMKDARDKGMVPSGCGRSRVEVPAP